MYLPLLTVQCTQSQNLNFRTFSLLFPKTSAGHSFVHRVGKTSSTKRRKNATEVAFPSRSMCWNTLNIIHKTGIIIQIIQPTRCNSFTSLLLDVYVWLNMFRASPRPSSGAYICTRSLLFYRRREAAGALLVMVWQVNLPDHDQQHLSRFPPTVKPEAPSAVVCS